MFFQKYLISMDTKHNILKRRSSYYHRHPYLSTNIGANIFTKSKVSNTFIKYISTNKQNYPEVTPYEISMFINICF